VNNSEVIFVVSCCAILEGKKVQRKQHPLKILEIVVFLLFERNIPQRHTGEVSVEHKNHH